MKIKSKQYAVSLYEVIKNLSDKEINFVLKNFIKILVRNNDLNLASRIIDDFIKYFSEKEGIIDLKIISAFPVDENMVEFLKKESPKLLNKKIKSANIKKETRDDLIGGFVIESGDMILDLSIKNKFKILKNNLSIK